MLRLLGRLGLGLTVVIWVAAQSVVAANPAPAAAPAGPKMMSLGQMFEAGGPIGYIITALSVMMVALVVEHLFSLRRNALMPPGLAESIHHHLALRHIEDLNSSASFIRAFWRSCCRRD